MIMTIHGERFDTDTLGTHRCTGDTLVESIPADDQRTISVKAPVLCDFRVADHDRRFNAST